MRVRLAGVVKGYGAQKVLDQVTLTVGLHARIGLVGPNGVGKSTLLRIVAGLEEPDGGTVSRAPEHLTAGYLPQVRGAEENESLLDVLARRTGVSAAERELQTTAAALARGESAETRYDLALERYLSLGAGGFEARAQAMCAELGLTVELTRPAAGLSGGETARAALASILLSRFDLLLLDEPTNDLDFDGLERLERFVRHYDGAIVLVSHDREFLDRTVTRILVFDAETRKASEFAGTYEAYERERARELDRQQRAYTDFVEERDRFGALLGTRREQARHGVGLGRRETQALRSKVSQAKRRLELLEEVDKPWRPWRLELTLAPCSRSGDVVLRLAGAVVERGGFRLGPIDLVVGWGDRFSIVGPNGSGKTTLLRAMLGDVPLARGARTVGTGVVFGEVDQRRELFASNAPLLDRFLTESHLLQAEGRTLLAKFGIRGEDALRPAHSLSPGERSRAVLAALQARGVNCLVLDEPTNHLDLEAIGQLEDALADYAGTVLLVTHDRRLLEHFGGTRTIAL